MQIFAYRYRSFSSETGKGSAEAMKAVPVGIQGGMGSRTGLYYNHVR